MTTGDESEDSESSEDEEDEEEREEGKAHNDEGSRRMNQDTIEDKPTQDEDIHHYKPLNADDILKQIVERKCRQSTQSFDLESAIQVPIRIYHIICYVRSLIHLYLFRISMSRAKRSYRIENEEIP